MTSIFKVVTERYESNGICVAMDAPQRKIQSETFVVVPDNEAFVEAVLSNFRTIRNDQYGYETVVSVERIKGGVLIVEQKDPALKETKLVPPGKTNDNQS